MRNIDYKKLEKLQEEFIIIENIIGKYNKRKIIDRKIIRQGKRKKSNKYQLSFDIID